MPITSFEEYAEASIMAAERVKEDFSEPLYQRMLLGDLVGRVDATLKRPVYHKAFIRYADSLPNKRLTLAESIFEGPFVEALDRFRRKAPITAEEFAALDDKYKSLVFGTKATMGLADSLQYSILQDTQAAIDKALENGWTFEQFKKSLGGRLAVPDKRLRLIFGENIIQAYNDGSWDQTYNGYSTDVWLMFTTVRDQRVDSICKPWDRLVAKKSDPIWKKIWPRLHIGCRCPAPRRASAEEVKKYRRRKRPDLGIIPKGFQTWPGDGFELHVPSNSDLYATLSSLAAVAGGALFNARQAGVLTPRTGMTIWDDLLKRGAALSRLLGRGRRPDINPMGYPGQMPSRLGPPERSWFLSAAKAREKYREDSFTRKVIDEMDDYAKKAKFPTSNLKYTNATYDIDIIGRPGELLGTFNPQTSRITIYIDNITSAFEGGPLPEGVRMKNAVKTLVHEMQHWKFDVAMKAYANELATMEKLVAQGLKPYTISAYGNKIVNPEFIDRFPISALLNYTDEDEVFPSALRIFDMVHEVGDNLSYFERNISAYAYQYWAHYLHSGNLMGIGDVRRTLKSMKFPFLADPAFAGITHKDDIASALRLKSAINETLAEFAAQRYFYGPGFVEQEIVNYNSWFRFLGLVDELAELHWKQYTLTPRRAAKAIIPETPPLLNPLARNIKFPDEENYKELANYLKELQKAVVTSGVLSKEIREQFLEYKEKQLSYIINAILRGKNVAELSSDLYEEFGRDVEEVLERFRAGYLALPPLTKDITVYRAFAWKIKDFENFKHYTPNQEMQKLVKSVGSRFSDPGFMSTTIRQSEAFRFLDEAVEYLDSVPVMFKIRVPSGTRVAYMNVVPGKGHGRWDKEEEILLENGTVLRIGRIIRKKHVDYFYYEIEAEIVEK